MIEISENNKKEFIEKGWTISDLGLSIEKINEYKLDVIHLKEKASIINYPLKKVYFSHLTKVNTATIESPFNHLIVNDGIKNLFRDIKLGRAVKELFGWKNTYLQLARLFVMEDYKYRGHWHRDFENWDGNLHDMESVQVGIYLQNQDGFRIFKPEYDLWGKDTKQVANVSGLDPHLPFKFPENHFNEIKGEAGKVLFFAPALFHQGNSSINRLDFHLRFSRRKELYNKPKVKNPNIFNYEKENKIFDFNVLDIYGEKFDLNNDYLSIRHENQSPFIRFCNSINYYTGLWNFRNHLRYKLGCFFCNKSNKNLSKGKHDIFANTQFQK